MALADELRAPKRIAYLTAIRFVIFEKLDAFDAGIVIERQRIGNVFVPADDVIDHEPAPGGDAPNPQIGIAHIDAGSFFDGLLLLFGQETKNGGEGSTREQQPFSLLDAQKEGRMGRGNDCKRKKRE